MDVRDMEPEDFLDLIWGTRPSWVDLPSKVGQYWVPYHMRWPRGAATEVTKRIDSCLRDDESLYFSVGQFSRRGRNHEDMLPTAWLWADLDDVHPEDCAQYGLLPTIAWQSSPERYQAMWKLVKTIRPETQERINQALSYLVGADLGGWDRTQVLRLPGTRNFKYPGGPYVRLLWYQEAVEYAPTYVWDQVKESAPRTAKAARATLAWKPMPAKVKALLRVPADAVVEGERSTKMWEIECLLAEAGWGEEDIYDAVVDCAWNKWSRVRTGERQLRREITKAVRHVLLKPGDVAYEKASQPDRHTDDSDSTDEPEEEETRSLPWVRYATFMATELPEPKWMVQDIWTAGSHGIIGGDPKTSKTGLMLALAVSVASGKPFLREYPVHTPGPVLVVQEENAQWMVQDRMRKLAWYHGLIGDEDYEVEKSGKGALGPGIISLRFPDDIPLRLLNNYGIDLTNEEDRELLELEIASVRPVLVLLDPLYLAFGGVDVDKASQMYPYLKWLLGLRNEYGCAIGVVHHFTKRPMMPGKITRRGGQRLLGTTTLHGWIDSAMYCETLDEERKGWVGTRLEREFRSMSPRRALDVRLHWGDPGELRMKCEISKFDLTGMIVDAVRQEPGVTAVALGERLGLDKRTVLGRARDSELLEAIGGRRGRGHSWRLYPSENGNEA